MKFRLIIATFLTIVLSAGFVGITTSTAQAAGDWRLQSVSVAAGDSSSNPDAVMKVFKKKDTRILRTRIDKKRPSWRLDSVNISYYKRENGPAKKLCASNNCWWRAVRQTFVIVEATAWFTKPNGNTVRRRFAAEVYAAPQRRA